LTFFSKMGRRERAAMRQQQRISPGCSCNKPRIGKVIRFLAEKAATVIEMYPENGESGSLFSAAVF